MFPSLFQGLDIGVFHCDDCEFAKHKCASFPKISFAINKVCQSVASPMDSHWEVVKRILRYLKGTLSHGLLLQPASTVKPLAFYAFCDANWASDVDDRCSTSGAAIFLGPNLISWWSRKEKVTARSNTEAEYLSLAQTSTKLTWSRALLTELKIPFTTLYCTIKVLYRLLIIMCSTVARSI